MGPPFVEHDWPLDLPVTDDEIRILEAQLLDLLPILNEASKDK
jgi:hypothetical protein